MNIKKEHEKLLKTVEKPARYIGSELNCVKKDITKDLCRFGFAFPDVYEIGMSYLGLQILYSIVNKEEDLYCERIFSPAVDMEKLMREKDFPLFTLETKTPIGELDAIGFTLQYEMSFTNVLNILDLGKIPVRASMRTEEHPFIIAGGPCAYNPEPLADVMDIFIIGDGEKSLPDLLKRMRVWKSSGKSKRAFLEEICNLEGIYVPSFYKPHYGEDGAISHIEKLYENAPDKVRRCIIEDINEVDFPTETLVPLIDVVHDRAVVETFRGCTRGCRFCQAGMIYRPVRERTKERIMDLAKKQLKATGHEELSLLSLSTSDYSCFEPLAMDLLKLCHDENISLSLPSLRLDSFSFKVLEEIQKYKKSGLTFAPEAGTQRLRDVINKGVTEKDIYSSIEQALDLGWNNIKLYFMIGLPTETYEDLDGIAEIAKNIVDMSYQIRGKKSGRFNVTVSVSNFVPKAHTPFQWAAQDSQEEFRKKHNYLKERLYIKHVTFNYHETNTSFLESVVARGDRRVGEAIIKAFELGAKFDAWTEHFKMETWEEAFRQTGLDTSFYTTRERSYKEVLPWDIIDSGIGKSYFKLENEKAKMQETTRDCRYGCTGCGMNKHTTCPMGGALSE